MLIIRRKVPLEDCHVAKLPWEKVKASKWKKINSQNIGVYETPLNIIGVFFAKNYTRKSYSAHVAYFLLNVQI